MKVKNIWGKLAFDTPGVFTHSFKGIVPSGNHLWNALRYEQDKQATKTGGPASQEHMKKY